MINGAQSQLTESRASFLQNLKGRKERFIRQAIMPIKFSTLLKILETCNVFTFSYFLNLPT